MSILITSFWTLHLIGWLSFHRLFLFFELWSALSFGPYLFVLPHLLHRKGQGLRYSSEQGTHVAVLWYSMWGSGRRGNTAVCSALFWLSVTSPATHKQIGLFWCWFPGGWVCVCSRILWVFPTNSSCEAGSLSHHCNPHRFFQLEVLSLHSLCCNPWLSSLSHSPVVPPSLSACKCGTTQSTSHPPCRKSSPPLPPVWMNVSSLTP